MAIGECMVEVAPAGGGLHRMGYAGDTFNAAWYARRLLPPGWSVAYATCVGIDAVSDDMLAFMARAGVDTAAVRRVEDRTVGLYAIALRDGERSFTYWRGQSAARRLADDAPWLDAALAGARVALFSGVTLAILSPSGREALCAALARARAGGTRVAFDTNLRPGLWGDAAEMREGVMAGAAVADVVLPSLDEEATLFGGATPEAAIARYREAGARLVAVKDGPRPIHLWSAEEGAMRIEPEPVARVVDTTAAGDAFGAGLLAGLALGEGVGTAARRAAALAARVVQAPGALVDVALPADEAVGGGALPSGHPAPTGR